MDGTMVYLVMNLVTKKSLQAPKTKHETKKRRRETTKRRYTCLNEIKSKVNTLFPGGFLNEAGWYADAQRVLLRCRDLCQAQPQTTHYKRLTLECCHR